jgi:subtilisin family serine protease
MACWWSLTILALSVGVSWGEAFRLDRVLIKPKPDADPVALRQFHARQGTDVARKFGGIRVLHVPRGNVRQVIAAYQRSGLVEFAEPDFLVQLATTEPNDPAYADGTLWGLHNTGQLDGLADADIDAPEAWDISTSASNIVVAVIDTGVRYTHEDLAGNVWRHPQDGSHGLNVLTGTNDPNDDSGHGTLIAGVVGATANNGKGIVGVAWQVQIMACKFANNAGGSISDAIACIDFARTNGAKIINASWGIYEESLSLSNAIYEARAADILVVAAAGNSARDTDDPDWHYFPASLPLDNVIAVAATTRRDELHPRSNIGSTNVDLAAPGENIYSTFYLADNAYGRDEGTSMAAAYVTGACALLRVRFPAESTQQIINRLLAGTDPLLSLAGRCVSGGRVNLHKALALPELTVIAQNTGLFRFRLSGKPQQAYVIEATTNLVNWGAVRTNVTASDGAFVFEDQTGNWPHRFFRAVSAP